MTKSGLSEATSNHIRATAEFLLPAHTNDYGEIDKGAIQIALFRELFTPEDRAKVEAALGPGKTAWLFESMHFTIYEMLRHKIRNLHQRLETKRSKKQLQIREIQQVFAGPTVRVAKLTLKLTPLETQLIVEEYAKSIKRLQWERRKFLSGLKKMQTDSRKYPTLGAAWGLTVVPKTARRRRKRTVSKSLTIMP